METFRGLNVNRFPQLERNADMLAGQRGQSTADEAMKSSAPCDVVQMQAYQSMDEMWRDVTGMDDATSKVNQIVGSDVVLQELYNDASAQLPFCNFVQWKGNSAQIGTSDGRTYTVYYSAYPQEKFEQRF